MLAIDGTFILIDFDSCGYIEDFFSQKQKERNNLLERRFYRYLA